MKKIKYLCFVMFSVLLLTYVHYDSIANSWLQIQRYFCGGLTSINICDFLFVVARKQPSDQRRIYFLLYTEKLIYEGVKAVTAIIIIKARNYWYKFDITVNKNGIVHSCFQLEFNSFILCGFFVYFFQLLLLLICSESKQR